MSPLLCLPGTGAYFFWLSLALFFLWTFRICTHLLVVFAAMAQEAYTVQRNASLQRSSNLLHCIQKSISALIVTLFIRVIHVSMFPPIA